MRDWSEVSLLTIIKQTYKYLMDKYNWDASTIDKQPFYRTLELINDELGAEEEVYFIDQV